MSQKPRVYVVMSSTWFYNDEYTTHDPERPVKAFSDREQAEMYLQRCEARERTQDQEDPSGQSFTIVEMEVED